MDTPLLHTTLPCAELHVDPRASKFVCRWTELSVQTWSCSLEACIGTAGQKHLMLLLQALAEAAREVGLVF